MTDPTTSRGVEGMSCDEIEAHGVAERYLLAELAEPDRDAYERHFFDCVRCFQALTTVSALRTQLNAADSPPSSSRPSSAPRWWLAAAAGVALGVGLWAMWPTGQADAPPLLTSADPTGIAKPPEAPAILPSPARGETPPPALTELARFSPPTYTPAVLRGPEDEAHRLFVAAMANYVRGEHRLARDGLRSAAGKNPGATDAAFFHGVCLLLTGQPRPGIAELRRTVALGNSPYLEEAHFYLAKGLLQVGDVDSARRELRTMIALGGDRQREAKQLLNQIDRLKPDGGR